MFHFEEKDLEKYVGLEPKWGAVGMVTYKRTYSRPIYKGGRIDSRESWIDTCVRVIEGNVNLVPSDPTATKEWAVKALDMMFHMAWLPPGRGLWMMGTEYARVRGGDALNNCWFSNTEPKSYEDIDMFKGTYLFSDPVRPMPSFPFVFTADRAMLGGGVGFSVSRKNISKFPTVSSRVRLSLYLNKFHPDWDRIKSSDSYDEMKEYFVSGPVEPCVCLDDSREGWNVGIRETIDAHWCVDTVDLCFDLSMIREYGAEIRGFGGTSSGVLPLIEGLISINRVLNSRVGNSLRSVDALDIMNLIGKVVVSGNVRRTALIAIGDPDDADYTNAKNYTLLNPILELDDNGYPQWIKVNGKLTHKKKPYSRCVAEIGKEKTDELLDLEWRQENHRWASNNSVYTDYEFIDFSEVTEGISANGEPGIVNRDLISKYGRLIDPELPEGYEKAEGVNPCGEITLCSEEPCNLVEVIPQRCKELGYSIEDALTIATQYAYRITFASYLWPHTQRVIDENHRIGVSLTGMADYFLSEYGHYAVKGFEDAECLHPIYHQEILDELDRWYRLVKDTNEKHAEALGSTPAIKLTTCKPSGTVAKLPGVSSGIHFHYSPYMIQRIRFHESDANLEVLRACGYPIEPDHQAPNTMVAEFPVCAVNADSPNFKCSGDVSIEEQFANQALFAYIWADNAVSATITFQSNEMDKISRLLRGYRDRIKSTSLLPYVGHGYAQAPWEPITKEEYLRRVKSLTMSLEEAYRVVSREEREVEIIDTDCAGGACPIR